MTELKETAEGTLLWEPSESTLANAELTRFVHWLAAVGRGPSDLAAIAEGHDYQALWRWSVSDLDGFWGAVCDFFDVKFHTPPESVLGQRQMPGAEWFPGATLNYAEHALRKRDDGLAVIYEGEGGEVQRLSYAELSRRVAQLRSSLSQLGVGKGDRVVAYMPNNVGALVAFLAVAALGAIWSSAAPEFGVKSVLDRFSQIEPKVLIAVDSYVYGGKQFSRHGEIEQIRAGLPTLEHLIVERRDQTRELPGGAKAFDDLLEGNAPLEFEPVPFAHPLYILYSSGTTGLPKPIVHGHGGILLEHLKSLAFHCDLSQKDRFFWFTTTGWMMWNFLVSGLLLGSTIVLFEGNPGFPDLNRMWKFAEAHELSYFGTSAPFLIACRKAGVAPGRDFKLSSLRGLGSTGAPLPSDGFGWVYEAIGKDLLLGSVSGGTDVCTAFVGSCPWLPVHAGEIQCAELGAKVEAYGSQAEPVVGEVGELVLSEPMPSMPVSFWNDPDGERYFDSYFSSFEGRWRHGDWIKFTPRGSCVIYGRSDSTLNRGGVRMGTSEFYRVVDGFTEFKDSLVVDTGTLDKEGELWLFVVLAAGHSLDADLEQRLKRALRSELSPRHVPDRILTVSDVPRTISGKKLEVPIKRVLGGAPRERVINPGTLANPEAVDAVLEAARG
ncbi:MAG: acetoacetate--CoA ligase [Polyangiaceae bacterium]